MLSSIEPGFYKEGEYGIRIEDDALVIDVGDQYISFEKINFVTRVTIYMHIICRIYKGLENLEYKI